MKITPSGKKEYEIGERFELEGVFYEVVEDDYSASFGWGCNVCRCSEWGASLACCAFERSDEKDIHFVKVGGGEEYKEREDGKGVHFREIGGLE